jgi:hypothetical protein
MGLSLQESPCLFNMEDLGGSAASGKFQQLPDLSFHTAGYIRVTG